MPAQALAIIPAELFETPFMKQTKMVSPAFWKPEMRPWTSAL